MPTPFGFDSLRALDDIDVLRIPYLAVAEARRRGLVTTWDLPWRLRGTLPTLCLGVRRGVRPA